MFSRFLLFFGAPAEGFARRRPAGADLVHDSPQNPCSFIDGHHVFGTKGAAGEPDVVLHSPQSLALSSTGTTSLDQNRISAG